MAEFAEHYALCRLQRTHLQFGQLGRNSAVPRASPAQQCLGLIGCDWCVCRSVLPSGTRRPFVIRPPCWNSQPHIYVFAGGYIDSCVCCWRVQAPGRVRVTCHIVSECCRLATRKSNAGGSVCAPGIQLVYCEAMCEASSSRPIRFNADVSIAPAIGIVCVAVCCACVWCLGTGVWLVVEHCDSNPVVASHRGRAHLMG